jgi:NAD(P)-dependent dehydrogenase (short-subunit alcohol dehydrogenase family)
MKELRDRVAVVTGGASGIGLGMARALADAGAKLVLADIEEEPLSAATKALREAGAEAVGVRCDVSDASSVDALRDETLSSYGAVHVLCNNAGVGGGNPAPIWDQPTEEWDWVMGVNLDGVIHGIQRFVPVMVEQGVPGHVVNTASIAGLVNGAGIYGVTKHAVVALSEAMYRDAQARGLPIGVSVLCPGWVNTRIHEAERNRPEAPRETQAPLDPIVQQMRDFVVQQIQQGMDPKDVGRQVVAAIRENRFYILTHPGHQRVSTTVVQPFELRPGRGLVAGRARAQRAGEASPQATLGCSGANTSKIWMGRKS